MCWRFSLLPEGGAWAIIVAPDSIRGDWNTAENERGVNLLLDSVLASLASYSIDTKKIVVTGFSMGGTGTWHFAQKYPQRFSAAVPLAGPRRPRPGGASGSLPSIPVTTRSRPSAQRRRASRSFKNPAPAQR